MHAFSNVSRSMCGDVTMWLFALFYVFRDPCRQARFVQFSFSYTGIKITHKIDCTEVQRTCSAHTQILSHRRVIPSDRERRISMVTFFYSQMERKLLYIIEDGKYNFHLDVWRKVGEGTEKWCCFLGASKTTCNRGVNRLH